MPRRYLVTSGLPYSNGRLHVGHIAGAYLPADTYVRYLRATGRDVLFICGSDDNGVAIEISALKAGKTPQEISTHFNQRQKADFAGLRIDFDVYGGTHQPGYQHIHERISRDFFRNIHDKGYFVKRTTKQLFDAKAGRFLPDRYVRGTCPLCKNHETYGDQCENTGAVIDALNLIDSVSVLTGEKPEVRETAHWYLRLNAFEEPLRTWLETKQGQWRPSVLNFALGQIKQGLPERAMTRDISWGISVPLDDPDARGKVLYVWFDAPIGYISFTAQLLQERAESRAGDGQAGDPEGAGPQGVTRGSRGLAPASDSAGARKQSLPSADEAVYRRWWSDPESAIVHFIGEDNTVFHTLIWPAMLMADGRHQLPSYVIANNFVNFRLGGEEDKISKSRTPEESPVWIEEYLKRFDSDALRYYLSMIAPEAARTFFDFQEFINRNNTELVAAFGNFVNRTLTFAARYFDNKVPDSAGQTDADRAHLARGDDALQRIGASIEAHRFKAGIEELMAYARACNQHFDARQPWSSRKTDMADCAAAIAACIHSVHYLGVMASPYMPGAAERIIRMLGLAAAGGAIPPFTWSAPPPLRPGHALGQAEILFAKLDAEALGPAT